MRNGGHLKKLVSILTVLASLLWMPSSMAYTVDEVVDAIWKAEGGEKATYPYGIRSIPCGTKESCRRIATNTVRNQIVRWTADGRKESFLQSLQKRYCPVGGSLDNGTCANWRRNVEFFIRHPRV